MLKSKLKVILFTLIVLTITMLVSTFSYATETTGSPDATEDINASLDEIQAAYDNVEDGNLGATDEEAEEVYSTDNSIEDNWINDDFYKMDEKVEINQIVDGNVFVIAKEVVINSEIGGDVYVMAEKITVTENAYIYCSLYAMGNKISINGIVCDAYLLGNDITIESNGYVYRDLRASANKITLDGKVRRNVYLSCENLALNDQAGTLIGGNLTYSSKNEASIPEGAVTGETTFNKSVENTKTVSVLSIIGSYIYSAISTLVYDVVVILLAIWLAPKFVEKLTNTTTNNALISLAIGVATPFVLAIAFILLLITGIASKVGFAALLILGLICISGNAITSIYLGNILAKQLKFEGKVKFVLACMLAALGIWLVSNIPFIGWLFGIVTSALGIGLLVFNIFYKNNPKKEAETAAETEVKE